MVGKKNFEIRKNDRDYKVGDLLNLREYYPNDDAYSGRTVVREVVYMTDYGQQDDYIVMGVR